MQEKIADLYDKHKGLIISCSVAFKPKNGLTHADYIDIGTMAFVKSVPKYNEAKSSITTFIYTCVQNAIKSAIKRAGRSIKFEQMSKFDVVDKERISYQEYMPGNLTKNEMKIIDMLGSGHSHFDIAESLGVTVQEFQKIKSKLFKNIQRSNCEN